MARNNAVVDAFRALARNFRAFQETYLMQFLPQGGGGAGGGFWLVPLWVLDALVLAAKLACAVLGALVHAVVPATPKPLHSETVLITGAGAGVGRELALQFAALGATVVCLDANPFTNGALVDEIRARDGDAVGVICEAGACEAVVAAAHQLRQRYTEVSMVVCNCAPPAASAPLSHQHPDTVADAVRLNLLAHLWVIKAFLPGMVERRHGHIVAVSSAAGLLPAARAVPHAAALYGLRGVMESVCEEMRLCGRRREILTTSVYLGAVSAGGHPPQEHRFAKLFPEMSAADAARFRHVPLVARKMDYGPGETTNTRIIECVRVEAECVSVPGALWWAAALAHLLPTGVTHVLTDFFRFSHRAWFYYC